jgi:TonB family protein
MNRLQRKCLIAAAMIHGLLIVIFVVGTAFRSKKKPVPPMTPVIELVNIVDAPTRTPGPAPTAQPVVRPQPAPPPKPAPAPKPAAQPPVKPEPRPEPKPPPVVKPVVADKPAPKPPPRPKVEVDLTNRTQVDTQRRQEEQARAEAERRERERQQQIARELQTARENLQRQASPSAASIESIGSNSAAFSNYAAIVKQEYERRWTRPQEISRDVVEVDFEVTIRRDGTVQSSRIRKKSGVAPMDDSIERLRDAVRKLPPFPADLTDSEQTFRIIFELRKNRFG